MSQRSLRDATITLIDGSGNSCILAIGDGNITWSEKRNLEYVHDKGVIETVREGNIDPIDIKMDFIWESITASSTRLLKQLNYTEKQLMPTRVGLYPLITFKTILDNFVYVSTGDDCEPYAVDLEIAINACGQSELLSFKNFRYESLDFDIKQGTTTCSGKAEYKNVSSSFDYAAVEISNITESTCEIILSFTDKILFDYTLDINSVFQFKIDGVEQQASDYMLINMDEPNLIITGAVTTGVNGTYVPSGIINGRTRYRKEGDPNCYLEWTTSSDDFEVDRSYWHLYKDVSNPPEWTGPETESPVGQYLSNNQQLAVGTITVVEDEESTSEIMSYLHITVPKSDNYDISFKSVNNDQITDVNGKTFNRFNWRGISY